MSLHRLTSITVGVPNVEETAAYYADFGLTRSGTSPEGAVRFATRDGGGDEVGRPGEAVNVRVKTSGSPRAFEPQTFFLERELQGVDRGVELGRQAN